MIIVNLGSIEYYDPDSNRFSYDEGGKVRFEYSLRAVYEWEAHWKKPFLATIDERTDSEITDFYCRMALDVFDRKFLTREVQKKLSDYVSDPSTATIFSSASSSGKSSNRAGKVHTSEEIYALMFEYGIPIEFEYRNLNRLLTILRIISLRNSQEKKMSRNDILTQNAKINAARKAKYNTKG